MAVFSKKNDSTSLEQESGNVLSAFRSTMEKLKDISLRAKEQASVKLEEAVMAQKEAKQLENIAKDNDVIASNINNLLNTNQDDKS